MAIDENVPGAYRRSAPITGAGPSGPYTSAPRRFPYPPTGQTGTGAWHGGAPSHPGPPEAYWQSPQWPAPPSPPSVPPSAMVGSGPPPPHPRRKRHPVLLTLLIVAGLGIVGVVVSDGGEDPAPIRTPEGDVVEPATTSALDLQPGDCYNAAPLPPEGSSVPIGSVEVVPCSAEHTAQVVANFGYAGQDYTEVVETTAGQDCQREFQARLRADVFSDQRYQPGHIYPDARSWQWNPSVACVIVTEAPTTGSALV